MGSVFTWHMYLECCSVQTPCPNMASVHLSPSPVLFSDRVQMQPPDLPVVVRERDALVPRDDVVVDGQDRLRVDANPGHLVVAQVANLEREKTTT